MKSISELRQDIVSGDWVVIATGRGRRPNDFSKRQESRLAQPKKNCPFETLHKNVLVTYALDDSASGENWWVEVVPNKYPAFGKGECAVLHKIGPYSLQDGVGFHEIVVTRDHTRSLAMMSDEEAELVVRACQDRYLALKDESCVEYITIFHNHGPLAGATITHPHSQLIAMPVIPPDVARSLEGSSRFFHKRKECVHCLVLKHELKIKQRVVYENSFFIILVPFASKTAFELRIYPKYHSARFEEIDPKTRLDFANALRTALGKLFYGIKDPDYNFFLHTAPVRDGKEFRHYHWHLEILPKTAIWAGFEIGTGIEISTISPEKAAGFLRKIKV